MIDRRVPFQPTGTNVVTNTAPTPGVRMRVVRRTGNTADVVGLGEDLQLRIEIDQVGRGGGGGGGGGRGDRGGGGGECDTDPPLYRTQPLVCLPVTWRPGLTTENC